MAARTFQAPLAPVALATLLLVAGAAWGQQKAGEVEYAQGVGFAHAPGQMPRTLGRGLPLREGDRLTTADGGLAVVKLEDGTRMTVRPGTELVLQQYQFRENAPDNTMLMQLVRGGFRAVTGLIAKGSPNAARVQTSTATIGIRGTDFDARICGRDCAAEAQAIKAPARPNTSLVSARLAQAQGTVEAVDASGQRRRLVDGGGVYPGDVVELGADARGALVFRDDSRISLGPGTRFRVDNFVYDDRNAGDGRLLVSLLRGSMRAVTGLIGKANTRNVSYSTATATIGIRGSIVAIQCEPSCPTGGATPGADASDPQLGFNVFVFEGGAFLVPNAAAAAAGFQQIELGAGRGAFFGFNNTFTTLNAPPPLGAPPVENMNLPPGTQPRTDVKEGEEGLYVLVRDGHIELAGADGTVVNLGRNDVGFVSIGGRPSSPLNVPNLMLFDWVPRPNNTGNYGLVSTLNQLGVISANMCPAF